MITLERFLKLINYKIADGSDYGWQCFGAEARMLTSDSGDYSASVVFDSMDQTVYVAEVCDYKNQRAYRLVHPDWVQGYLEEAKDRDVKQDLAWDNINFCDLETEEDFESKLESIVNGRDYDTRVQVPVDFTDEELLTYMKKAHELDITFNRFVEMALEEAIARYKDNM